MTPSQHRTERALARLTPDRQPPPSLPAIGDVLGGKYRIDRLIGAGGMGSVFAAHHTLLDEMVAIKIVAFEVTQSGELSARFLLEARASARVKSEHVARVLDVDMLEGGLPYLVMELLDGMDFAEKIAREGAMPVQQAVDAVLQALDGLSHAHAAGIIHRDIKPSNLFLANQPDGTVLVKVLDFGISKSTLSRDGRRLEGLTGDDRSLGSPGYMSPEQMRDSAKVDVRADIFAVGAVLYEILAGRPAWEAETIHGLFAAMLETSPVPLSRRIVGFSLELESIVLKCLRKDPAHRYQNVAELAQALAPFGSSTPNIAAVREPAAAAKHPAMSVVTMPEGVPFETRRSERSRRGSLTVGLGAVGVVVAILGGIALGVSPHPAAVTTVAPAGSGERESEVAATIRRGLLSLLSTATIDRRAEPRGGKAAELRADKEAELGGDKEAELRGEQRAEVRSQPSAGTHASIAAQAPTSLTLDAPGLVVVKDTPAVPSVAPSVHAVKPVGASTFRGVRRPRVLDSPD
jgi:serine/threonine protein kinase